MTIVTTYQVQCDHCGHWLADRRDHIAKRMGTTTPGKFMAKEFTSEAEAEYVAGVQRGWRMGPETRCPECQ